MTSAEFEPAIPAMNLPQTNVLDRTGNGFGPLSHTDFCNMLLKNSPTFKIYN